MARAVAGALSWKVLNDSCELYSVEDELEVPEVEIVCSSASLAAFLVSDMAAKLKRMVDNLQLAAHMQVLNLDELLESSEHLQKITAGVTMFAIALAVLTFGT